MNRLCRLAATVLVSATAASSLTACFPLLLGGAVVSTAVVYTDRRTSGAQLEDQAIELKALNRLGEAVGKRARVSVTSYNRLALITGEVTSDADRALVEQITSRIENVHSIVNEVTVTNPLPESVVGADSVLTSRVKASLVDSNDVLANALKVVTERSVVYLMGRVTEREANRAADTARSVSGVQKVVKVFEIVTEAELATLPANQPGGPPPVAPTPRR
jgi:osmotically-inducible protein OsmY